MITPVILCGGSGTRLWPLSRNSYPKQLLPLVTSNSLLQDTVIRSKIISQVTAPLVICHEDHRFLVAEQLQQMGVSDAKIMLEPVGKNTAPAAALAALYLSRHHADPLMLVLPADHVIQDTEKFHAAVKAATVIAETGCLVTFGVIPTKPETGYGYIKKADSLAGTDGYRVDKFVEKPDFATAEGYVNSKEYFWNSGIFMFRASSFIAELREHAPAILAACEKAMSGVVTDLDFMRIREAEFADCPSDSIDYAVMEKTQNAAVVPLAADWSDVGSWSALYDVQKADEDGNVVHGDVFTEQVNNSYLRAESRMLAVVGVSDHIVVETPDAVLVAHKDHCQDVKAIVASLKARQRPETNLHRRVYRPWGHYETVDKSTCFLVKRITVKPGARLSLQMHHFRSEHWVVVSGNATVTRDEETFLLSENQSTYIPVGVKHRLENAGTNDLELIEVQSGTYLGEDDIVRFEDVYGRANVTETV
jgi:mannose-1-phosphate guanylyltransferase/mannose-6-phosphate isomerase